MRRLHFSFSFVGQICIIKRPSSKVSSAWRVIFLDSHRIVFTSVPVSIGTYIFFLKLKPFSPEFDNLEFEKCIPDIYPAEIQLNKANTSNKETSFYDLNIKGIVSDMHTSVYDKRDDFRFPIVNFPWFSGDVSRLPLTVFTFRSWLDLLGVVLAVLMFFLKNSQILQKC